MYSVLQDQNGTFTSLNQANQLHTFLILRKAVQMDNYQPSENVIHRVESEMWENFNLLLEY